MLENILKIILAVDVVFLTVLVLMQSGRVDGFSAAITGGNKKLSLFSTQKSRGSEIVLDRLTFVGVVIFMVITTVLRAI